MLKISRYFLTICAVVCSIVLFSSSVSALSKREWIAHQERQIKLMCDDGYTGAYENLPYFFRQDHPGKYECPISSLFGLKKILYLLEAVDKDSMEWLILQEMMDKYYIKEFDTFDFKAVHQNYEDRIIIRK